MASAYTMGLFNAGLNNQRYALFGLVVLALENGARVRLPELLVDFSAASTAAAIRTIAIDAVLDRKLLEDFLRSRELLADEASAEVLSAERCFETGSHYLRGKRNSMPIDDLLFQFLRACRGTPRIRATARMLRSRLPPQLCAVQLRVERDWQDYASLKFADLDPDVEEIPLEASRILRKIKNNPEFSSLNSVYACCDEENMLIDLSILRDSLEEEAGISVVFKSDSEGIGISCLYRIQKSMLDFEVCHLADKYVGLTRSTFSNMVSMYNTALSGSLRAYIYNVPGDQVRRRTDGGMQIDALKAVRALA